MPRPAPPDDEDRPPGDDAPPPIDPRDPAIVEMEEDGAIRCRHVLARDAKQRLDKHLISRMKGMSRHQIQRLISLGGVTVNAKPAKASTKLKAGDVLEWVVPPRTTMENIAPEDIPLQILYEDQGFVVINKPADLVVHPARSYKTGTLLNALAHHFQQENAQLSTVGKDQARPGVVHRLDKHTTGCILVAKQEQTHWLIAKQFEHRTNLKAYLAVVHGNPDPPSGAIHEPIGKHPTIREAHAVRHDSQGKDSLTLYRVRERYDGYALVEFELKTGRTHQIRVHSGYLGHPIVGDIFYGGDIVGTPEVVTPTHPPGSRPFITYARTREEGDKLEAESIEREKHEPWLMRYPALHAALLTIHHPATGKRLTFTAPVHRPMLELIHALRAKGHETAITDGTHVNLDAAVPDSPI